MGLHYVTKRKGSMSHIAHRIESELTFLSQYTKKKPLKLTLLSMYFGNMRSRIRSTCGYFSWSICVPPVRWCMGLLPRTCFPTDDPTHLGFPGEWFWFSISGVSVQKSVKWNISILALGVRQVGVPDASFGPYTNWNMIRWKWRGPAESWENFSLDSRSTAWQIR